MAKEKSFLSAQDYVIVMFAVSNEVISVMMMKMRPSEKENKKNKERNANMVAQFVAAVAVFKWFRYI